MLAVLALARTPGISSASTASIVVSPCCERANFSDSLLEPPSIGSSFEPFVSRGPGDTADWALVFRILNSGPDVLTIRRAVYFLDPEERVPILPDAKHSQVYVAGFEVKFGRQWKSLSCLLKPGKLFRTFRFGTRYQRLNCRRVCAASCYWSIRSAARLQLIGRRSERGGLLVECEKPAARLANDDVRCDHSLAFMETLKAIIAFGYRIEKA